MEQSSENWLLFLDKVIVWTIFTFIILLPFPHVTTLKAIAKVLPVAAWMAKMIIQKRFLFKKNPLTWPIIGYLGACLLSLIPSANTLQSLNAIRSDVISPILLYIIIVTNVEREQLPTIFSAFLVSGILISAYGIWAFIHGNCVYAGRAILTFDYPTVAGRYLSVLIASALGLSYVAKSWWIRSGIIISLLVSVMALFLTQARGGIAATLIAFIIFALLKDKRLLVLILLVPLMLLPVLPKNTVDRAKTIVDITTYTGKNSTMYSRYGIWQASVLLLKDKWLTGVGYGWKNVGPLLTAYKNKYNIVHADPVISHSHNTFLEEWLELGLIGFIMFVWLVINIFMSIWSVLRHGLRDHSEAAYIASLTGAICGLFAAGMITFFLRYEMVYLFWIILGVFMLLVENNRVSE